jgi:hypothetical protein
LAPLLAGVALAAAHLACAQQGKMNLPQQVEAGTSFSIQTTGNGKAVLYIVGPGQALRRDVQLGETTTLPPGSMFNAGHYLAILVAVPSTDKGSAATTDQGSFDVLPANHPADLSFLAKPSRLPVSLHGGITGAVYVFDAYRNLITTPAPVSFELSNPSSGLQQKRVSTQDGAAWTQMDSTPKEGADKFVARVDGITSARVVEQVAGDPCGLKINARQAGQQIELQTDPVRDCSGNPVPDGTIVTFTENYNGAESTVDAPLKRGIAQVEMPAHNGATISVASGVVLGNEIHWGK